MARGKQARASGRDFPTRARNASEGAQGQEPPHGKQHSSSRPGQATLLGASRMSLLCPHPRRCRLMLEISRRIHGAPQRRRGVRSRARLRGGGERRGPGEVEEEPTWLDGGRLYMAQRRKRARRARRSGGGAHVADWGLVISWLDGGTSSHDITLSLIHI